MKGKLLRSDQSSTARAIRMAVGANDTESVQVVTPTFDRTKNMPLPSPPPALPTEWNALHAMTAAQLKKLGCGNWDGRLMLFPAEWYDWIPNGFRVMSINDNEEEFQKGITDNDRRFGCLAYGVVAIDGKDVED